MAVDYFTKWAEVKALANIRDVDIKKFVWKNIVTIFGVPNSLISDNGLQFDSKAFCAFRSDLGIKKDIPLQHIHKAMVKLKPPNKEILNGLKKRLDGAKGK